MEKCQSCDRPARGLVLAKSSEEMVGPGMAVWMPTWTCESLHRASDLVPQIEKYDPGALVLSFECYGDTDREGTLTVIEPGHYGIEPL